MRDHQILDRARQLVLMDRGVLLARVDAAVAALAPEGRADTRPPIEFMPVELMNNLHGIIVETRRDDAGRWRAGERSLSIQEVLAVTVYTMLGMPIPDDLETPGNSRSRMTTATAASCLRHGARAQALGRHSLSSGPRATPGRVQCGSTMGAADAVAVSVPIFLATALSEPRP